MSRPKKNNGYQTGNGANLGFEATLWAAADKMRNNMDAAEYKHVVLGLIFLKYISDAFEERRGQLEQETADPKHEAYVAELSARYTVLEDRDEYAAKNVFWVPPEARWDHLLASAKQPGIGKLIDQAMVAIERDNPKLKGVLPKDYARPGLDAQRLGELLDLLGTLELIDKEHRSKDTLGRVYEYFLSQFALAEGKKGGQFYTPRCVVRVLVEMLAPYQGRVFDPCCGSGGMFVQSEKFVAAHGGRINDLSVYGQESNYTTWRLAKMNLAIRGIEANLGPEHGDSFHRDLHPDLKSDYVLANPPFNDSDWGGDRLREDVRWKYGVPPAGNANYAWVQHFIHHLAPHGLAGFVLANGSMSTNQSGEGEIRKNIIEADLVDCMVALPGQLFYSTQIPVCLWFIARSKKNGRFRDRRGQTLFIDARKMGTLIDRVHRDLTAEDIARIAGTYHAWRGDAGAGVVDHPETASPATGHPHEDGHPHRGAPTPTAFVGAALGGCPVAENMSDVGAALRGRPTADARPALGATTQDCPYTDTPASGRLETGHPHRGAPTDGGADVTDVGAALRGRLTADARPALGATTQGCPYTDVPGFCKSATLEEIRANGYVLTPGRYVGAADVEDDDEPFEEKMGRLVGTLEAQFAESARLEQAIRVNLRGLGYGE